MDDERVVEESVTKFFLNTCRLRPEFSKPAVHAAIICAEVASAQSTSDDVEVHWIPLTTGSVAEFYIEPMLLHVGDIDVMCHQNNMLTIPRGQSPPTQLPAEFHNYVKVYEIIDSHLPGYVYLKLRYLLTECIDDEGKYNASEYDGQWLTSDRYFNAEESDHGEIDIHGPAMNKPLYDTLLSVDHVPCVRCLSWPSQAADWPSRHRNYGWPDTTTIDHVVTNGCDVVGVAHRQCKHHQWMAQAQWRLSFSRAEIVLTNSWMPVQQIVYHMLRVFMKTDKGLTSAVNSGEINLSNYHIKTLMLWACELKSNTWWTGNLCLVRICVELMHDLAVWLSEARCPHYFSNNCNLADNSFKLEIITNRLLSVNKAWLSSWFVNKYIRKCSKLCPGNVPRLFNDVSTTVKLQNAISAVVYYRIHISHDQVDTLADGECFIMLTVSAISLTVWSLYWWFVELAKVSTSFSVYFVAVAYLHISCKISRNGFTDELMDVLAAIAEKSVTAPGHSNQGSSFLALSKAAKLMKVVANNLNTTEQMLVIELSKAYIYRALRCKDSDSDSVYCLANVYLAVLYYTTGQYQTAIDHCTLVTRSEDHSQCNSCVVQGELLPKLDDDIDVVLGLAVLYQHLVTAALNQQQQTQHVTVFTTELFAHYLHITFLSAIKCQQLCDTVQFASSDYPVQSCVEYIIDTQQLYVADLLLWKSLSGFSEKKCTFKICDHQSRCQTQLNATELTELLQQSAVEHLTTFRQFQERHCREHGFAATIVTTDFEAMYAYKRGDYQRCLQLSMQNVHTLLYAGPMTDVMMLPEVIQLLDDDIVSLIALTLIVDPECREYKSRCSITQLTLSLYLMTQCQLKLRHSVTSLRQTLNCIRVAQRRHPVNRTLDRLTLKLSACIALTHLHKQ